MWMDNGTAADGRRGLPADWIKILALATMLIDHVGVVFWMELDADVYMLLRSIGRMAFPLYAFLLVEGFFHTRNVKKYLIRLSALAVISELPFDYAFYWNMVHGPYLGHQNIFFTLALALAAVWLIDTVRNRITSMDFLPHLGQLLLQVVIVTFSTAAADWLGFDYGGMGVLLVLLFYYFHSGKNMQIVALAAWFLIYDAMAGKVVEAYGIAAVLPILFYRGEKGNLPLPKWFFYGFYPAHLLVLAVIRNVIFGG